MRISADPAQPNLFEVERAATPLRLHRRVWWITAGYAAFAVLWIYFSDRALQVLISDPQLLLEVSTYKGVLFVGVTTLLLFLLIRRTFRTIDRSFRAMRNQAAEIRRLNRLYAALSQVNQAIVTTTAQDELFAKTCRVLVEYGGFRLAWIGLHEADTQRLLPVAEFGDQDGHLHSFAIYGDERTGGHGPAGRAFREAQPVVANDFLNDPAAAPWQGEAARRGIRAVASFPIRCDNTVIGVLTVYAHDIGFFQEAEIALLNEAATDVSFALDNFVRNEQRRQAETLADQERLFSERMIESLPGIAYFYDRDGGFLRWNHNFEIVSGYGPEEIARMHPREFFPVQEQPLVEARIGDVFRHGEASVEADFRSKDGHTTPYSLTGRRVTYQGQPCLVGMGIDISARREAEMRLAASERKYRELVENANSIILRWNAAGQITLLNDYGLRFFGYSAEEIVGRHVLGTIVPDTESSGRDLQSMMEAICASPEAFEHNVNENVRRDGRRAWISWTNRIVWDDDGQVSEILSIGTDITSQVVANEALRRSEEQFRLIMENLADLVAVIDLDGRRIYNSPSYQGILGSVDHLHGSSSFDQVHPDDKARVQQAFQSTVETGIGHRLEYRLIDQHGQPRYIESQGSVIRDSRGAVNQVVVVSRDVTERREAEQAIRELNASLELRVAERTAELERALIRAEAADRLKSAFLATMSHELRTPLNSIIGFTGILVQELAGPLNPEQAKQLGMVQGSARHLLELINDVLDISKIEAGQLEVRAEAFDLAASIERVTASIAPLVEKKNLALVSNVPANLPEMVSDRRRVEQILINLLNNAVKFTDDGQVTLTVECITDHPDGTGGAPRPSLRLCIEDTGIGIKEEDLAVLFQPFRQIDTGLSRQHEGTGLGLAICRRLVTLLGGSIKAESTWQQGSRFTVVLPLQAEPTP